MKKERIYNVFSLICNIIIPFCTALAVANYFRTDVIENHDWVNFTGFQCFRFFTVLSNVAVSIAGLILIYFNVKNIICDDYKYPKWVLRFKFVSTAAVFVTFTTVLLFLAPASAIGGKGYFPMFSGMSFFMHFTNPVFAILSFVLCERDEKFSFKETWIGIVPVVLYSIVYTIMVVGVGEANGGWPDFYYFTFGGVKWAMALSAIIVNSMAYGLSVLLWWIQKKIIKKNV